VCVCENRVLRTFGPKRGEVTGGWRKLYSEELHILYCSPSTIGVTTSRRMRWVGHVARMGAKRNAYRILVGKPEGKRPLGRPSRRYVGTIKVNLRQDGLVWTGLIWLRIGTSRGCLLTR
jgi:hypothetical protein